MERMQHGCPCHYVVSEPVAVIVKGDLSEDDVGKGRLPAEEDSSFEDTDKAC